MASTDKKPKDFTSTNVLLPGPKVPVVTSDDDDTLHILLDYLNLAPDLPSLYAKWAAQDPNFSKKALRFPGIRILRQDPWETLVGFICSSNNNIGRISQMMDKLCIHYGPYLATVAGKPFHDFPPPEALAVSGVQENLQKLGFGYRAKYIHQTAKTVANEKGLDWLYGLANPNWKSTSLDFVNGEEACGEGGRPGYQIAHEELLQLQGVGPKVADCICLMGLGWSESVPIDTHVWQIAVRDYKMGKSANSTLTKRQYQAVAQHFRNLWGHEAGWAHSVLFTADLKTIGAGSKVVVTKETIKTTARKRESGTDFGMRAERAVEVVKVAAVSRGRGVTRVAAAPAENIVDSTDEDEKDDGLVGTDIDAKPVAASTAAPITSATESTSFSPRRLPLSKNENKTEPPVCSSSDDHLLSRLRPRRKCRDRVQLHAL